MKIAIYGISKNEGQFARRFAESIRGKADLVSICDTGSTDGTQEILRSYGFEVHDIKVEPFRFDVARNLSLSKLPDDIDVAISVDLDDIMFANWREVIEKEWKENETKTLVYPYVNNWEKDEVTPKMTIWGFKVHAPKDYFWKNPIHEVLEPKIKLTLSNVAMTGTHFMEHRPRQKEEREGRISIFEENFDELKEDSRMLFLYGKELYVYKRYEEALVMLLKYLAMTKPYGIDDDTDGTIQNRSFACRLIGSCHVYMDKPAGEVLAWFIRSVGESPSQREPWIYLSQIWEEMGESINAYSAAKIGTNIDNALNSLEVEGFCWDGRVNELLERTRIQAENQLFYTNNIEGWMSQPELQYLHNASKKVMSIVEIGCWKGRSTHALLSGCRGVVYAVDHFKGTKSDGDAHKEAFENSDSVYNQFNVNVGMYPNLKVLRMSSEEAVLQFEDGSIDMVFIDGEHTYDAVKRDIELWTPKTKMVICGHDYGWDEVKQAVDEKFDIIKVTESIWSHRL